MTVITITITATKTFLLLLLVALILVVVVIVLVLVLLASVRVGAFSPSSLRRFATRVLLPLRWRWDGILLARVWLCARERLCL